MTSFLVPGERGTGAGGEPSFSIVIAAHQVAGVIGAAVASALEQTLPALEVIVSDDGSTDGLDAALEPFGERVQLLRHDVNTGEAGAKNRGAQAASGEYVAILDADDVFLPARLERLAELAAARPDLDILTTDALLTVEGSVLRRCYADGWEFETIDQRRGILERNFVFGLVAVRREALLEAGGYDPAIRHTTDWELWARMILGGARAGCVDEPLAEYRLRPTSLSADRLRMSAGRIMSLERAASHPSLDARERAVVAGSLAAERRRLAIAQAQDALITGTEARRRSLAVALAPGMGARTRLKALGAALAPELAGARLRRDQTGWVGAGGIRVPGDPAAVGPSSSAAGSR